MQTWYFEIMQHNPRAICAPSSSIRRTSESESSTGQFQSSFILYVNASNLLHLLPKRSGVHDACTCHKRTGTAQLVLFQYMIGIIRAD